MALQLRHQTPQQFAVRLRARFRAADRARVAIGKTSVAGSAYLYIDPAVAVS